MNRLIHDQGWQRAPVRRCDPRLAEERRREGLARRVARMLNSYVVPGVPPFTRRELLTIAIATVVIGGYLSLLILGTLLTNYPL